ncbi:MAG: GTPase HflX [Bdellovibrionales bacterium]
MKQKFYSDGLKQGPDTALIVHPVLGGADHKNARSLDCVIGEAEGLARAIALRPLETQILKIQSVQPGAYFCKGQRAAIADLVAAQEPDIIIVNTTLSPVQQRNLEKAWNAKVIDRTGLILEIFGARAQTKEGRLQVDLAALSYQKSRLVRSWTHLERQRGGAGFMGGPGERQIEIDRRLIEQRITKLKKELEVVRRTRDLGRKSRARVPYPVVALVGYTNAGKSTLFNALTDAGVMAEDMPFATLDPTLRQIELPNGQKAILSDTVGFIADLPTHLIAAFRATLEETIHADVIVHVIDAGRGDYTAQYDDVVGILKDLGIDYDDDPRVLEVYNKVDQVAPDRLSDLQRQSKFRDGRLFISALKGQGLDRLLDDATRIIAASRRAVSYVIAYQDGKALAWLHDHGEILERNDQESGITVRVMLDEAEQAKFESRFSYRHST